MVVREDEPLGRGKSSGAAAACGEDANGSAAKLLEIFGGEAHPVALRQTIRRQPIQTPHPLLTEKMPAHHDRKDVDQDALHHQQILGQRHTGNQTRRQANTGCNPGVEFARAPMERRFSFAVYLAGDNNLSEEMVWSLQEMKAASREPSVRERIDIAALFDPRGGEPRRYDFTLSVEEPVRPPTEDTAELLARLLAGMAEGRRMLVLSGHGSGAVRDFLNDEKPASSLSIPRLGKILERASIEILGLDSCQMSTVEVGYEVRGSVSHLVASEGPVLNAGWPYRQVLASVAEHAAGSSDEIARTVADSYLHFYRDYEIAGVSTDIAVCDLSKGALVAEAVGELARAMTAPLSELAAGGLEEAIELGELKPAASKANEANQSRAVRDAIVLAHS